MTGWALGSNGALGLAMKSSSPNIGGAGSRVGVLVWATGTGGRPTNCFLAAWTGLWAGIIRAGSVWLEGQACAIAGDAGVHHGAMGDRFRHGGPHAGQWGDHLA
jgi:hypothetical protein